LIGCSRYLGREQKSYLIACFANDVVVRFYFCEMALLLLLFFLEVNLFASVYFSFIFSSIFLRTAVWLTHFLLTLRSWTIGWIVFLVFCSAGLALLTLVYVPCLGIFWTLGFGWLIWRSVPFFVFFDCVFFLLFFSFLNVLFFFILV